jgi:exopolyphosphatase/guanosine-5'-triphosphate,3'-diphosphate pyrophosphatase
VQLGAGIDRYKRLTPEVQERALACLERFGQRLRDLPQGQVRAVGTNTLRLVRHCEPFLVRAEQALGHPIEVIAGREEARLVYLGVAASIADDRGQRLVVDIGGGSTEYIIGMRAEPIYRESLFMGCVSYARHYFPKGRISRGALDKAELAARRELQSIEAFYRQVGWNSAVGASGTINAIARTLQAEGLGDGTIDARGLQLLRERLLKAGHVNKLELGGLKRDRAPIFPSGVAILTATFAALGIERMSASDGALREGLLNEIIGRFEHADVRERTVDLLVERYRIDTAQAARVSSTALSLHAAVAGDWQLTDDEWERFLTWAGRLHELGLFIAHNQFHRHGAYLLSHADLDGFSRQEQQLLAMLVRAHRRKFPVAELHSLPADQVVPARRLAVLLRLAALLNRSRSDTALPELAMRADGDRLSLVLPTAWLDAHPLTEADLHDEAALLEPAGFQFSIVRDG